MTAVPQGDQIRVVLAGCGYIAQAAHIPSLLMTDGMCLAAVVDRRERLAWVIGGRLGVPAFTSLPQCLDSVQADAVIVSTGRFSHPALVTEAANRGLHVLVEKPLADTVRDARAMTDSITGSGVVAMVGYMRRYDDDCEYVRETLRTGRLGRVHAAVSHFELGLPPRFARFDGGITQGSGPPPIGSLRESLLEESIHHINLMRFWFGEVSQVLFVRGDPDRGVYEMVFLSEDGVLVTHLNVALMGHGEQVWVYGDRGNVHTRLWSPHFPYRHADTVVFHLDSGTGREERPLIPRMSPYLNLMTHFRDAIRDGVTVKTPVEDAVRDLEAIEEVVLVAGDMGAAGGSEGG
ncbi:MAG: Gfo/Idh/MocA family oxidoreductase [Bacillota bacterium]